MTPRNIAHYEILGAIGKGGMGVVYRARDRKLGRVVALKLLRPDSHIDSASRARFLREAQAAAVLHHAHIATIFEVGEAPIDERHPTERWPYIAMELVEGEDLRALLSGTWRPSTGSATQVLDDDRLATTQTASTKLEAAFSTVETTNAASPAPGKTVERRPLPFDLALEIGIQIADALAAAHEAGVVHRDLKPANIRISPDGEVKLVDFGLAKILEPPAVDSHSTDLTFEGTIMGTPPYMAPEQLQSGEIDARADLFALGVVLYEMVTGRTPWIGSTLVSYLRSLASGPAKPASHFVPTGLPPALDELITILTREDAAERTLDAEEVATRLRAVRDGETPPAMPRSPTPPERPWLIPLVTLVVSVLVVLGAIQVQAWWESRHGEKIAIAILPLATADTTLDTPATGISFSLNGQLRRLRRFSVADWAEVLGLEVETRAAGAALQVDWVLAGRLEQERDRRSLDLTLYDREGAVHATTTITAESYQTLIVDTGHWLLDTIVERPFWGDFWRLRRDVPGEGAFHAYAEGVTAMNRDTASGYARAERFFDSALAAEPEFAAAWAEKSELFRRRAQNGEPNLLTRAHETAERALVIDPNLAAGRLALGNVLRAEGELSDSVVALKKLVELYPYYDKAHRDLAQTYEDLGEDEQAGEHYLAAIEARPGNWRNHLEYGAFLFDQRDLDGARGSYKTARALAPVGNETPIRNLTMLELQVGDLEAAEALIAPLEPVADQVVTWEWANTLYVYYYFARDFGRSRIFIERAIELNPTSHVLFRNLAELLVELDEPEASQRAWARALELHTAGVADPPTEPEQARRAFYLAHLGRCDEVTTLASQLGDDLSRAASRDLEAAATQCGALNDTR
ncbi:MAG: serine/threonine-protein kinase [Acidobacteriota bacterium]